MLPILIKNFVFMRINSSLTSFLCAVIALAVCQSTLAFYTAELVDAPAPIIFEALIEKKPRRLLLDSGMAIPFALNRTSFPQLQGKPNLVNGEDIGALRVKLDPNVKFGHFALETPEALLMDTNELARLLGADIEGIVGTVAFGSNVIDFNYTKRIITISESGDSARVAGGKTLELIQEMSEPAVHVIINGKPVPFLIDTGFNGNFRVNADTLAELKIAGALLEKPSSSIMLQADGQFHSASDFNLTKHLEPFNEVDLAYADVTVQEGKNVRNVIGLDLLRCYNSVFDFKKSLVHLSYRQDEIARMPSFEIALGMRFEFVSDDCRVREIKPKSEFIKKYGIKVGHKLVSMGESKDSTKPTVWTMYEMYKRLSDSVLSGIPLDISFTDGSTVIHCVFPLPQ